MKKLVIAEKASAGKDIAKVLGLIQSDMKDGFMENDQYIVGWARGHLVGLQQPKEILGEKEAWNLEKLPFQINIETQLKVLNEKGSLQVFNTLKKLINRDDVECIINAGDSGREGELIQQWIYKIAGNKKPIKRLWVSSLTDESIKKAFNDLQPNDKYKNLYEEGKALKVIDWMYGMSYTVLLTKLYTQDNAGVLHYGRCQTPLLNLIVKREDEIVNFKKEKYNLLQANFGTYKGTKIILDEETKKYINEALKFVNNEEKIYYLNQWKDIKEGIIEDYKAENKATKAPRCFSMSSLQQTLGKKYGFSPEKTLELAQSLYEKKYTTYPRTNSEYLSTDIWNEKERHINSCYEYINSIITNISIDKSKEETKDYVDNAKIEDHHAIIPTEIKPDIMSLSDDEKIAYEEIAKRFLALFMKPYKYKSTSIITKINDSLFKTTGTQEIDKGYKLLYTKDEVEKNTTEEEQYDNLPELTVGQKVNIVNYALKEGETKPKARYNVGNITALMDKYGIGTQATQAAIIENILKQEVIKEVSKGKKKEYAPTDKGIKLISLIPEDLKTCDLSKRVEERIKEVGKGKLELNTLQNEIYNEQIETIKKLKEHKESSGASFSFAKEVIGKCPFCGKDMVESKIAYGHSDYKDNPCKFSIFKNSLYTTITSKMAKDLLEKGKTVGSFKSKAGKTYKQEIILDKENQKLIKGEFVNSVSKSKSKENKELEKFIDDFEKDLIKKGIIK